mmetsp:Transcript_13966/g.21137  ORF Transcript_13966/g.21137 Transcript_13966/m.21137 type:complete len:337 (+) Transcript_13966:104-1114(+)
MVATKQGKIFGIGGNVLKGNHLIEFDRKLRKIELKDLSILNHKAVKRWGGALAAIDDQTILYYGGVNHKQFFRMMQKVNVKTLESKKLKIKCKKNVQLDDLYVHSSAMTLFRGDLYIYGGASNVGFYKPEKNLYRLCVATNTIEKVCMGLVPMYKMDMFSIDDRLYIIGGMDNRQTYNTLFEYNPMKKAITRVPTLGEPFPEMIFRMPNLQYRMIGGAFKSVAYHHFILSFLGVEVSGRINCSRIRVLNTRTKEWFVFDIHDPFEFSASDRFFVSNDDLMVFSTRLSSVQQVYDHVFYSLSIASLLPSRFLFFDSLRSSSHFVDCYVSFFQKDNLQ